MGRAGRRGDPSYWLANRRRFHDDLDKLCRSVNERQPMDDMRICHAVAECLNGSFSKDRHAVRETATDGKHKVFITLLRPEGGAYYLTLTIEEDHEVE